jgi:hypothetical protein
MGDQSPSFKHLRRELTCGEHNVVSSRVGIGVHLPRRLRCLLVRVDAHLTEVVGEARLEEITRRSIKRLTWRVQYFMHDRRRHVRFGWTCSFALQHLAFFFLFALLAFAARAARRAAGTLTLHRRSSAEACQRPVAFCRSSGHDVVCHAVGLLFVCVMGLADAQTTRNSTWRRLAPRGWCIHMFSRQGSVAHGFNPSPADCVLLSVRAGNWISSYASCGCKSSCEATGNWAGNPQY